MQVLCITLIGSLSENLILVLNQVTWWFWWCQWCLVQWELLKHSLLSMISRKRESLLLKFSQLLRRNQKQIVIKDLIQSMEKIMLKEKSNFEMLLSDIKQEKNMQLKIYHLWLIQERRSHWLENQDVVNQQHYNYYNVFMKLNEEKFLLMM